MTHEQDLYGLLTNMGGTYLEKTSEDKQEVYPDPKGRPSGSLDSPQGEKGPEAAPGKKTPAQYGDAANAQSEDTRRGVVSRSFSGLSSADQTEQKLMKDNFESVARGDFTTHSLHLKPKQKVKEAFPRARTLKELVEGI